MKRERNKLTAARVRAIKKPGLYSDGFNLNLQVREFFSVEYVDGDGKTRGRSFDSEEPALAHQRELSSQGTKAELKPYVTSSWIFRYWDGTDRKLGLGSTETTSLAKARELAQEQRELLRRGVDPIKNVEDKRTERKLEAARAVSFRQAAEAYIEAHRAGWRNAKHASQWPASLSSFVYPIVGDLPVQTIDTPLVMKVLEPLWTIKNETASRLRGRIESILDWAKVRGYRTGENPARWKGHLDHTLPSPSKVQGEAHHAAHPYEKLPSFMATLRAREGLRARAVEFCILTVARAGEAVGACWSEIDFSTKVWTIPGERMKAKKTHRVALSDRALAILAECPRDGDLVFPGVRVDQLRTVVRDLGEREATVHGFRSSFADWLAKSTAYPRELGELALAHVVGDATERAYRRGDGLDKRRRLMTDWSNFCLSTPAECSGDNVVLIGGRA